MAKFAHMPGWITAHLSSFDGPGFEAGEMRARAALLGKLRIWLAFHTIMFHERCEQLAET